MMSLIWLVIFVGVQDLADVRIDELLLESHDKVPIHEVDHFVGGSLDNLVAKSHI